MAIYPGQFSRTRQPASPPHAHTLVAPSAINALRLSVTFRRGGASGVPSKPAARSEPLRRDKSLLDVTLPRLEVLHAPLRLLSRQVHFLGDEVDALRAVELLVVGDAGRLEVYVVCARPFLFYVRRRLFAT